MAAAFPRSCTYASAVCSIRRRALGVSAVSGKPSRGDPLSEPGVFEEQKFGEHVVRARQA